MIKNNFKIKFKGIQDEVENCVNQLIKEIKPRVSEIYLAERLSTLLNSYGFNDYNYPILIYGGENTGMPISRNIHMPSNYLLKNEDIVFVDCTPLKNNIWGNWS